MAPEQKRRRLEDQGFELDAIKIFGFSRASDLAFDGDRQGKQHLGSQRPTRILEFLFDGVVHDPRHVRTATPTSHARTGCARDFTCRAGAIFYEATNLAIGNSATLANEHQGLSSSIIPAIPTFLPARPIEGSGPEESEFYGGRK